MDTLTKAILEEAFIGFWEWNIPQNTAQYNSVYQQMLGYGDDELENTADGWKKLIFPEDLAAALDSFKQHVSSHGATPYQYYARYKHKNGSAVWINCAGHVTGWDRDGQPLKVAGCIIDITAQKIAEEKLTRTETLLNETNEVAQVGAWELDLITNKLFWTKVIKQIYEVPDDYEPAFDISGGKGTGFSKNDGSLQKLIAAVREAMATGKSYDLEIKIITGKGNERWTRVIGHTEFKDGVCVRIYGTLQNIDQSKKTQEELEIREQQFRSAFENSTIGMALVSPQGNWIRVNQNVCNLLGYTNQELMTKTFQQITHPDDLDDDMELLGKLLANTINSYQLEKRYIHKNGQTIWVLLSVSLVRDNVGEPLHFVSQIENITLRRSAEIQLKESEAKYRRIFENVQDVFYQTDYDGIVTEISPSIENYAGYKRDQIIGTHVENFYYYPQDRETLVEQLKLYGKISDFQVRLRTSIDETVYASVNAHVLIDKMTGLIVGFEGSMRDIRERKIAEDALKERDALLTKLSEQIPGVIFQFQFFPDGRSCFPFASNGTVELFGLTPDEIKYDSAPAFARIHKDDFDGFYQSVVSSFSTLDDWGYEFRWIIPGKPVKWMQGMSRPERLADGSVIWHGYVTDITEKKGKEQQLQSTFELVTEQNNRLINFAYIISHNLRTHSGNFEMLVNLIFDTDDEDEKLELMLHLKKVSEQLSQTIMHLNEVVSIQTSISEQRSTINLYTYIEKTIAILKVNKNQKAVVNNNVAPGLEIEYNPAYIESILFNFLSNAIKYGKPGRKTVINIDCSDHNGHLVLQIADNGLGMDLQKIGEDLFGMYKTFHRNSDAKGIGLFITKNQVEAMGGKIEVESEVDKGTTFKIYLT
jgi:PAS domain S-box-containing protein